MASVTTVLAVAWMGASGLARRDGVAWMLEWPDLVLVQVCCAWPLACVLHRVVPSGAGGLACSLACGGIAAGAACGTASGFASGMLQRGIAAAFALVAARGIIVWLTPPAEPLGRSMTVLRIVTACVLSTFLPGLYAWHQSARELDRVGALIGRERPVAALRASLRVQRLRPEATWNGQPLSTVVRELSTRVDEIRESLAWSASGSRRSSQLERCRALAAIDRTDDAIVEARALAEEPESAVPACLLLASLFEERSDWASCRGWYAKALRHLEESPYGQNLARTEALQGLGFAEQNLGNHVAAEAAYLESLQGHDGAGAHSLLSGLYADAQNLRAAQTHAALAAERDPRHLATQERLRARATRDGFCRPQPTTPPSLRTPESE